MSPDPLAALEGWVDALEAAGDDADRLEALAAPPPAPEGPIPAALAGRVRRLAQRIGALEARLEARRAEIGRIVAATARPQPASAPHFIDQAF